eukprot:2720724-Alexandrium_andersonii.AAC.1
MPASGGVDTPGGLLQKLKNLGDTKLLVFCGPCVRATYTVILEWVQSLADGVPPKFKHSSADLFL